MKRLNEKKGLAWKRLLLLLYLIGVAFFLYFNKYGYKTYLTLIKKQQGLKRIKSELANKKETLKRELELQNASSPFFIEMIARERLRMAKEGEYIYFLTNSGDKKKKDNQ